MSLREEVQKVFAENVATDPLWIVMAASEDHKVEVAGDLQETLQALVNTLMAATNGLTGGLLHLADAVDDLRREIGAQADDDAP